jgi:hypothetical protein
MATEQTVEQSSKLSKDNTVFNIWSGTTNVKIKTTKPATTLYIQGDASLSSNQFPWEVSTRASVVTISNIRGSTDGIYGFVSADGGNNLYMDTTQNYRGYWLKTYYSMTDTNSFKLYNTSYYLAVDGSGLLSLSTTLNDESKWSVVQDTPGVYFLSNYSTGGYLYGDVDGRTTYMQASLPGSPPTNYKYALNSDIATYMTWIDTGPTTKWLLANSDGSVSVTSTNPPPNGYTWVQCQRDAASGIYAYQSCYGGWLQAKSNNLGCELSGTAPLPGQLDTSQTWQLSV